MTPLLIERNGQRFHVSSERGNLVKQVGEFVVALTPIRVYEPSPNKTGLHANGGGLAKHSQVCYLLLNASDIV